MNVKNGAIFNLKKTWFSFDQSFFEVARKVFVQEFESTYLFISMNLLLISFGDQVWLYWIPWSQKARQKIASFGISICVYNFLIILSSEVFFSEICGEKNKWIICFGIMKMKEKYSLSLETIWFTFLAKDFSDLRHQ